MKFKMLWRSWVVVTLFLFSCIVSATNIDFAEKPRNDTHARVLFQFSDDAGNTASYLSDATQNQLQKAVSVYEFEGKHDSKVKLVAPAGDETMQLFVMGLGAPDKFGRAEAVAMGGKIAQLFTHKDVQKVDVIIRGLETELSHNELAATIAHGISLGSYRFNKYLEDATVPNNDYHIIVESDRDARSHYKKLQAVENGVFLARDLVNHNAQELNPVTFIESAQAALDGLDIKLDVFDAEEIKEMNMGLLYSVGQGSVTGSRLMIAHYEGSDDKPIALVGKGITFDTGGYNIKTHKSIAWMKGDMAGAAAVLGTVRALAEQEAKVNVIALMPLAENMVSEHATRPGDIITSMSGKSVEIVNTDAEGRLIMADAMWYAQEQYQPQVLLNIATLTGSKIRALGERYGALFSDDEALVTDLTDSGKAVNELLWRLPLAYGDMLKSTLADSANIGSGGPGASTAAMFLKQFVQEDMRWVSLDIAGNETVNSTKDETPAGATGYGVRLLTEWLTRQP